MTTPNTPRATLVDSKIDIKIKLSALWAAIVFFFIYGDYFALYVPGKLSEMLASKMGMLGPITLGTVTQGALVGASIMLAIPSLLVFLSLVMNASINRWINISFGALYTLILLVLIQGGWIFLRFYGVVEIALTLTIVWQAWKWPRTA